MELRSTRKSWNISQTLDIIAKEAIIVISIYSKRSSFQKKLSLDNKDCKLFKEKYFIIESFFKLILLENHDQETNIQINSYRDRKLLKKTTQTFKKMAKLADLNRNVKILFWKVVLCNRRWTIFHRLKSL